MDAVGLEGDGELVEACVLAGLFLKSGLACNVSISFRSDSAELLALSLIDLLHILCAAS